jgi:diguanylate cyclase (GGDEF)-like protein
MRAHARVGQTMTVPHLIVVLLPGIGALAMVFVAAFAFNGPYVPGRRDFGFMAVLVGVWCGFASLEYLTFDFELRRFLGQCIYLGAAGTPAAWLIFALRYTGRARRLTWYHVALLCVVPAFTMAAAFSNDWHGLIWSSVEMATYPLPDLVVEHGWWFRWVHVPYSYTLFIAGLAVLVGGFFRDYARYRRQVLGVVVTACLLFLVNFAYIAGGFSIFGLDPSPLFASVFVVGLAISLFRGFLGSAPLSYREVFMASGEGMLLLDAQQRIVDINATARDLASAPMPRGETLERALPWLSGVEWGEEQTLAHGGKIYRLRHVPLRADGAYHAGAALILRDITAEIAERDALQALADRDGLTGCMNRRAFSEFLDRRLASRPREWPLTLVFVDLDHFKSINDDYGHAAGDEVLRETVRRIEHVLRPGDVVGRVGGDEFAVLLDRASSDVARTLTVRISTLFAQPVEVEDGVVAVSGSIGYATWPADGQDSDALFAAADMRMYEEKRRRRESAAPPR